MLNAPLFLVGIGCTLGFLSGLGVGGGSLLMLWLTCVAGMEHSIARSINLLFFIPAAMIATFFRWKQGCLPLAKIWPAILAGCGTALVFSLLSRQISTDQLKKLFGLLLLATGIREVLYRPRNAR